MSKAAGRFPLRVAVYAGFAERIRSGELAPGERIPSEADIAESFDVSRLTAREGLLLLEEDGFLENRRGVGRYVADRVPEAGLEGIRPIDQMLSDRIVKGHLVRLDPCIETATDYSGPALEVEPGTDTILLESELQEASGHAVCMSLEWLPVRAPFVTDVARMQERIRSTDRYLLDLAIDVFASGIKAVRYNVSVTTSGTRRGERLGVDARAPVLVLGQVVYHDAGPVLASKHIVRADVAHFAGVQNVTIA